LFRHHLGYMITVSSLRIDSIAAMDARVTPKISLYGMGGEAALIIKLKNATQSALCPLSCRKFERDLFRLPAWKN